MRRLEGVQEVVAPIGGYRVNVTPAPDRTIDFAAIGPALWRAGISMQSIEIVAEGTVEEAPGPTLRFRIAGWPDAYPYRGDPTSIDGPIRIRAEVMISDGKPRLRLLSAEMKR